MGRSRITRTFHNKPVEKSYKPKQSTSIKKVVHKQKFKSTQSKGLIPQAHAQESAPIPVNPQGKYGTIDSTEDQIIGEKWGSFGFTINKTGRPHGRNVKIRKSTRGDGVADTTVTSKYTDLDTEKFTKEPTILGKFAQGIGNQAQDIGGGVHGLVTGQDYTTKSILSKATEHAFAGDWDSAGKVISDNPYRFAGNVATEASLAIIPFGMVARGAGIAGKVGSAASKVSKGLGKAKFQRKVMTARKKDNTRLFKERGYATGKESRTGVILKSAIGKTKKPKKTKVQKIQKDPWQNPKSPQITGAHIPYERRFGSFANSGDKLSVGIVDSSKLPITKMTMLDGTEKTMGIGAANYAKEGAKRLAWLKKQGLI